MSERRTKDPLSAAISAHLLPALRSDGFRKRSSRIIGRMGACCFQLLDVQKSSFGGGRFCVNYASMLLIPPQEDFVLQPGERLESSTDVDKWWPDSTHDEADASMREVVLAVRRQAMPFFDATRSATGLLEHLLREDWSLRHHLELARGVCFAWLGEEASARKHLAKASALYDKDGREWSAQGKQESEALLSAIANGTYTSLLRDWRAKSVEVLGLSQFED